MADASGSNPNHKGSKKRVRNPSEWKREKRKLARIAGKEYVNTRGEVVEGKRIGDDCNCRRMCYKYVPEEVRKKLFEGYYALRSHDEQNAYLFGLIRKKDIARKRSKESVRRTCTYTYYIRNRGEEIQVCRLAFARIHGISSPKIRNLCLKLDSNVMFPRDGRGKHDHRPKKISDETIEQIRHHINSILGSDQVVDFIKEEKGQVPDVNITKMWKDYLRKFEPEIDVDSFTTKQLRQLEPRYRRNKNNSQEEHYHHEPIVTIGVPLPCRSILDRPGDHYMNLGGNCNEPGLQGNVLSNFHRNDRSKSSASSVSTASEHENQSDEEADGDEHGGRKTTRPSVKHWLYSKIFHEEIKSRDIISLRKRLCDFKGGKSSFSSMSSHSNSKPTSSHSPKSLSMAQHALSKADSRKQKMPKKIAQVKGARQGSNHTPESPPSGHSLSIPAQLNCNMLAQNMYVAQMHQQQAPLLAVDLATSQQSHLQHLQHQNSVHSFPFAATQHLSNVNLQNAGNGTSQQNPSQVQRSGGSSSSQSSNLSQANCNYMNLSNPSFYS